MSEEPSLTAIKDSNAPLTSVGSSTNAKTTRESQTFELGDFESKDIRRFSAQSGLDGYGVLDLAGADAGDAEPSAENLRNDSSSVIKFYPEWCRCFECLRNKAPYSPNATCAQHCREVFLCPPQGPTARIIAFVLVFGLAWVVLFFVLEKVNETYLHEEHDVGKPGHKSHILPERPSPASPMGPLFALGVLELIGLFFGILMKIIKLPALLGPLLLGIALRNIHPINIFRLLYGNFEHCVQQMYFYKKDPLAVNYSANSLDFLYINSTCEEYIKGAASEWIKPIRQIALTMILTRAGLELSPKQLKKLKGVVPLLAFGPCVVEACFCALFTWLAFSATGQKGHGDYMHILMCFVSGFALAAVSPAVVVPGMLTLKRKNLGTAQGIPTLLIAASSIDDVLAISAYTIFLSLTISSQVSQQGASQYMGYIGGPLSILIGIAHGFIVGPFLHFIPSRDTTNKGLMRLILLLLFNLGAIFGYEVYEPISGAGSLAVLVTSFIASFGWRSQPHWKKPMHKIEKTLASMWTLCVPLLFGTIGKEIDFSKLQASRIWRILLVIFASLIVRCFTAFMIVWLMKLNVKERLFCAMSWVPKATVQAALAPLVITKVHELQNDKDRNKLMPQAEIVVTTAVLAILITAPLGSCLIAFFAPRLLKVATVPEKVVLDAEFPHGDGNDPTDTIFSIEDIEGMKRRTKTSGTLISASSKDLGVEDGGTASHADVQNFGSVGSVRGRGGSLTNFSASGSSTPVRSGSRSYLSETFFGQSKTQ